ncbi:hypothetical protein [Paracoccus sp. R86501]|uniref:hypothetical protein n=1 Tax=Paracoccus sp. R86501 TaxID=3101711 RepID=UPI00366F2752
MKTQLSISALVLAIASPAFAFDSVTWTWDATVLSDVTTGAVSDVAVAPTGLEQIESEQTALGDFTALGSTLGVTNDVVNLGGLTLDDVAAVNTGATSLGNSASLASDVSTQFDSTQLYGGASLAVGTGLTGGLVDVSVPGLLTSTATTNAVVNATVDNTATGVANNLTADLTTISDQDAFMIGNNVQTAYAVGTSTSTVDLVSFTDVNDLGTLVDPAVSSVATSIGNNIGVTIDGIN